MNAIKKRFLELQQALTADGNTIHASTLLARAAQRWPTRTALICDDETITYRELHRQTSALAQKLTAEGLKLNDRLLIMYENSINFYRAYYAAWQAGAIVVPLNVYLHEKELEHIIKDSQPTFIIASEKQQKKLETLTFSARVFGEEFFNPLEWFDTNRDAIHSPRAGKKNARPECSERSEECIEGYERNNNDCTVILYTSGTTGLPKGVMFSSKTIITNSLQGIANFAISENERIYAALPLFHSYMQNAAVWSPFIVGATVIIIPSISRGALLKGFSYQPTVMLGIPHLYGLCALMKTVPLHSVKLFISGGDHLQNKIRMGFELIYNRILANGYGLTETGPFIGVDLEDTRRPAGCIGKAMEGIAVEIRDAETDKTLPVCKEGVLWVKGDNCMLGYYNAPEATAKIMKDGWINTGDIAYLTSDGFIVLCGREKDMISHKGMKIYPPEVENILTSHSAVTMAAVIGVMQQDVEVPVAFVTSKADPATLIPELKSLCETHLAYYKVPVHFYIKEELPLTATGKVDKKILRKELEPQK